MGIDVIQVHDVEFCVSLEQVVKFTLPALAQLKAQGKVRYIGVTGYNLGTLQRLIEAAPPGSIDTVLSYCRATLFDRSLLGHSLQFFKQQNIALINASPVSMGLLEQEEIPTTLISTASRVNLDKNLSLAKSRLTEKQNEVLDQLWLKYFRLMTNVHWESM